MENTQSSANLNLTETTTQQQVGSNNSRLLATVVIGLSLTAVVSGSAVYYWQKSTNEEAINNLKQKISSLEEQISTMRQLEATPSSVANQTENWTTYTSSQYYYSIRYPREGTEILDVSPSNDFHVAVVKGTEDGFPFPQRADVAVKILQNPDNLPLPELGNQTFATDAPEPYDLGWKPTTFAGKPAFRTTWQAPGDAGTLHIHILSHKNNIYAIWYSSIDKNYDGLARQILSTFQFSD